MKGLLAKKKKKKIKKLVRNPIVAYFGKGVMSVLAFKVLGRLAHYSPTLREFLVEELDFIKEDIENIQRKLHLEQGGRDGKEKMV